MFEPGDFDITEDEHGAKHAIGPYQITVLPHVPEGCESCGQPKAKPQDRHRIFYQREVDAGPGTSRSALVAQLGDVRVYFSGTHIVVTGKPIPL